MFTGIITDIGTVRSADQRGDLRIVVDCGYDMTSVGLGASIACSGACLTVVDKGADWFAVDVSGETQSRTHAATWLEGSALNLERSLRVGDEMGGHIVTGHIDGVGEVLSVTPEGGSLRVEIAAPDALAPYIAASDALITTAAVPGRPAPLLVTADMVEAMRLGSVVVDLAAESGGNVEGSRPGQVVRIGNAQVWGGQNVPSQMPGPASRLYAQNVVNLLTLMTSKAEGDSGVLAPDFEDEIVAGSWMFTEAPGRRPTARWRRWAISACVASRSSAPASVTVMRPLFVPPPPPPCTPSSAPPTSTPVKA